MNLSDTVRKLVKDIAELTKLVMNIRATAGGGVTGGQNIGVGGVGVYHSVAASTMRFRTVNAASAQIAVSLDAVNNEVDIELGPHTHQAAGSGGQLDHGLALTGLGDDDHTIYLLASGARALAGNWDAGAAAGRTIQVGNLVAGGAVAAVEYLQTEGAIALKEIAEPGADAGYGKIFVSSVDGLPYFKDDTGGVCAMCTEAGSGGGGVADALYIIGEDEPLLPNARTKQALYYNYDLQDYPAAPDALDDEFDDGAIDIKWAKVNEDGTYPFNESDMPGFIWFGVPFATSVYANSIQFYQAAPSGEQTLEFIARVCISNFIYTTTNYSQYAAICLAFINDADAQWIGPVLQLNASHTVGCSLYMAENSGVNWATATGTATRSGLMGKFIYLKLAKTTSSAWTASNIYKGYCSYDGITWDCLESSAASAKTFGHDVDRIGFIIRPTNLALNYAHGAIDFFRRTG